jgi:hypothetical protein
MLLIFAVGRFLDYRDKKERAAKNDVEFATHGGSA